VAFPILIFWKLMNAQQHYVHISCTLFYPDWTVNVESTVINSFMYLRKVWLLLDIHESMHCGITMKATNKMQLYRLICYL